MKIFLITCFFQVLSVLVIFPCLAQNVAISATGSNPDSSAMLDVSSINKGMLIPQISLTGLTDAGTIAVPAHSLLVYNTNAAVPGGKGYYYNSGNSGSPIWTRLATFADQLSLATIGSTSNANGASILGSTLTLQPADGTYGGILTAGAQTISGEKAFSGDISASNLAGTNTGNNAVNSLYSGLVSNANHSGDATGSTVLTLAAVNSNVGSYGSATQVPTYSVNGKGLITAAGNTSIQVAESQVNGLTTNLGLLAPKASPTFTGSVIIPTPFTIGAVSMTTTGTRLNYLSTAGGTTGTTSSNLVFSTSPVFITPRLTSSSTSGYVWTATDALGNGSFQSVAGVNTMAVIGNTSNANGASISGSTLTLQPASNIYGGIVTTGMQTFAGMKHFTDDLTPEGRLMLPMGEMSYFNISGTLISITAISDGNTNLITANPVSTFVNYKDFDNGGSNNGTLRYTGAKTKDFHIACTVSFAPSTSSAATFVFGVAKNGTVLTSSKVLQRLSSASTDINSTALHVSISLSTNDTLTFKVGNITGTGDIRLTSINLFALGM